jgi:MinD-like ATPase involved in chromosome partitioning or flagellar assembly
LALSRYLKGNRDSYELINGIIAKRPDLRIIFFYGAQDSFALAFVRFLEGKGIYDYYIGSDVRGDLLKGLLFKRNTALGEEIKVFFKRPKTIWLKELDHAVMAIYSNSSNGKSHMAWNLATALGELGYKTTLLNVDRGYSANLFFKIPEVYQDLLDYTLTYGEFKGLLESCYSKGTMKVISGRLGKEPLMNREAFAKLLQHVRAQSDIVLIDTYTGIHPVTLQAMDSSTIDFVVFDGDLMRFHMNKLMLENLESPFIENKTYAVINNCSVGSEAYRYIYRQIMGLDHQFKDILSLGSCGSLSNSLMHTGKTPYEALKRTKDSFSTDVGKLLQAINARNTRGR